MSVAIEPARARLTRLLGGRPLRYALAGGLNTVFGLGFYPLLVLVSPWLRAHYVTALLIAQAACLVFAFATYKLGVFRTRANLLGEFARFASFYVANYALNIAALPALVEGLKLHPALAQTGFSLAVIIGSYFWHSRVTFRSKKDKP